MNHKRFQRFVKFSDRLLAIGIVAIGIPFVADLPARAADDSAALAKALPQASLSLEQGLKASEHEGTPISGKYELDNGVLQLSLYTMKGDRFSEGIVTLAKNRPLSVDFAPTSSAPSD